MKLIRAQQRSIWTAVVSLVLCTLFLTACKDANETNAGLCNGNWGMVGAYYCDIIPIGRAEVLCVFVGKDNDRNGAYQSGTSDQCVVDGPEQMAPIDCNEMCRLNNNCSKVQCLSAEKIEELNKRLSKRSTGSDLLKSP
ncbi:hypothetical protein [Pseudomonas frederiksbergensis]|uniref:hypothetical protein n=1 Tax=Pseudomonas frederiksbergensis TaxID=104087 RepID=UPI001114F744|nr:hypothetical protein [Pseudomonas frederiksbergensis]